MKPTFFFALLMLLMFGCQESISFQEDTLKTAVWTLDEEATMAMVDELAKDLLPNSRAGDPIGHHDNLDLLVEGLRERAPELRIHKVCYACIYTQPAQSEIRFSVDSAGQMVHRILTVSNPEEAAMKGVGLRKK